jgi:hypothetical protein
MFDTEMHIFFLDNKKKKEKGSFLPKQEQCRVNSTTGPYACMSI